MTAPSTKHLSAEWLSVYLDGQVTPAQRQAIETHLRACRQCAQEMQTLKQTVSLLHQVPQVAAPRPLTLREIEVQPAARPRRLWVLPYLQGATALATLLLVVLVAGDLFLGLGRMPLSGPQSAAPHAYTTAAGPQAIVEKVAEAERLAVGATVEVEAPVAPEIPEKGLAEGATPPMAEDQAPLAEVEGEAVPSMEEVNGVALEATASPGPLMRALGGEASATPAGEEKVVAEKEAVAPELTVSPGRRGRPSWPRAWEAGLPKSRRRRQCPSRPRPKWPWCPHRPRPRRRPLSPCGARRPQTGRRKHLLPPAGMSRPPSGGSGSAWGRFCSWGPCWCWEG